MAKIHWILGAFITPLMVSAAALAGTYEDIARPFSYELYTSDVFPWIDGTRRGEINDSAGRMADGLKKFVDSTNQHIEIAVYGVQKQEWFLDSLRYLKRRPNDVTVEAVVDQRQGEVDDWDPENFDYPDTAKMAGLLGSESVKPDIDRRGNANVNSIMHNKFIVVDRKKVWLGSANISHTDVGSEYNANIAMVVKNPEIARIYSSTDVFHRQKIRGPSKNRCALLTARL